MLQINESFTTAILVTDSSGDPASGKDINYKVYDETFTVFSTGTMTEITGTGIYYIDWTPDAAGYWIVEVYYDGDFKLYDAKIYQVASGVEEVINNILTASPTVDSILFKSGGATCPTGKSIWDALGDGTVSINTLNTLLTNNVYGLSAIKTLITNLNNITAASVWSVSPRTLSDYSGFLSSTYSDITVYPWAGVTVLNADPACTYTAEVSQASTDYTQVAYFDFDESKADIKTIFLNLIWEMKITGAGSGKVKWQIASGSNANHGGYVDITDESTETSTSYVDHSRSGIATLITGLTTQIPFTIQCLVANVTATSAQVKVKSNSYIRVIYKRVS